MRGNGKWVVGFLLAACLGMPVPAFAGPYVNLMQPCDCPPTHYSDLHVLTPRFYRWAAWCQGPNRYIFAKIQHPDIPPTYWITKYHCPSINPLQFSVANYPGLGGPNPCSVGQPFPCASGQPSQRQQQQSPAAQASPMETPPQLLPTPKEEKK